MKLALGTVQFGLEYGIVNRGGRVSHETAAAIIRRAESLGIRTLDTAMGYGDSEQRLGEIGVGTWRIVTKLPECPEGCPDIVEWVNLAVRASLQRLGSRRLHGLLLHRPAQLLETRGPELFAALQKAQEDGLVDKIGVSVYEPADLAALVPRFSFTLVQLPFNILDDRFRRSGWLAKLADRGVEIHARSAFLQGLLLMPADQRPNSFARWADLWSAYDRWLEESQLTPLAACLRVALAVPEIDQVVVGVDSVAHLAQIVAAVPGPVPVLLPSLRTEDTDLLNPSRWGACHLTRDISV